MLSPADHQHRTCFLNRQLVYNRLVVASSGNASIREYDRVCIKPSGADVLGGRQNTYPILDLATGQVVNVGDPFLKPSTDTASHLYLYRAFPKLNAIVHTHSTYATAFAQAGRDIPCGLTAIADEFGGPVRCARYARIGGEEIGEKAAAFMPCKALLLEMHGVLTFGWNPDPVKAADEALKSAIMLEDCAKTMLLARQFSINNVLPQTEIDIAHKRYSSSYGQSS